MAPVKVKLGQSFKIVLGSDLLPSDASDEIWVNRRVIYDNRHWGELSQIPLDGPVHCTHTKGSYVFPDLKFTDETAIGEWDLLFVMYTRSRGEVGKVQVPIQVVGKDENLRDDSSEPWDAVFRVPANFYADPSFVEW